MSGLTTKHASSTKGAAISSVPRHWLSRPGYWLGWALMLALLSTVIAFQQAPHRNAYRPEPKLSSWDYWGYPVERNAFRRLPAIAGNLNDLAVSEDGQHIWTVGNGGLIVYSDDAGQTWRQAQIGTESAEPVTRAGGFWIREAQAGMPDSTQQQQSVPYNADNAPFISRKGSGETNVVREISPAFDYPNQSPVQNSSSAQVQQDLSVDRINIQPTTPLSKNQPQADTVDKKVEPVSAPPVAQKPPIERDPKRTDLYSVHFVDTMQGWTVGDGGVILFTVDGGKSWQRQTSGTSETLNSVYFVDPAHGWAVGQAGMILATSDGGKSWKTNIGEVNRQFNTVRFYDNLHGWAVGQFGSIVATVDGGQTWQIQVAAGKNSLSDAYFIDNQRGWAVGDEGAILATTDGGKTWKAQVSDAPENLYSVYFEKDGLRGWVAGQHGVMLATVDGGRTWQAQTSGTSSNIRHVRFSSDGAQGWLAGDAGTLLVTVDAGNSWQAASQKALGGLQFLADGQKGWIVGADGVILSTADAGKIWHAQPSATYQHLSGLQIFADGSEGWAVGSGGTLLHMVDKGKRWQAQSSGVDGELYRVQFVDGGTRGWVVGESALLASQDSGQSWQRKIWLKPEVLAVALYFQEDGVRGWVAGDMDRIYVTNDAGASWQSQVIGFGKFISGLYFENDGLKGWAVGKNGTILSTRDAGKNWQPQVSSTKQHLWELAFAGDGSRGWAVGSAGTIVATQNGGDSWQAQISSSSAILTDIYADNDGLHAWTVGAAGTLLATSDGGEHWQDPVLPYQRYPAPWYYLSWLPVMMLFSRGLRLQLTELREPEAHDPTLGINPTAASDKPTGPGSKDYLGSLQLARDLSAFLRNENTQPPLTLAITGDWGSGKSSVMNYLQAELRREGLRPVWYNAWHHQEEQQVLGSILECVRRQATPPLWPWLLPGLWFRLRLLTHRRFWLQVLAVVLLTGFCWLAAFAYFHEEAEENQVWHFVSHLAGLEQPAVLTAQGHARLCGKVEGVATPAKSPADQLFSAVDCQKLACLVNAEVSGVAKDPANCKDTLSAFASDDELLVQAGKVLEHELTQERKQAIVKQLEHSPGKAPFALPAWLTALLTVLTTVAGVAVVKGASLFGLASTDLLKTAISKTGVIEAAEPVGTRQIWERRFERLTGLLGRRRLVLFIDDLDRCSREHALRVLETCNFLVSSGELFIVMGIAPKYVLANVKLHFKELAEALHEFDDNGQFAGVAGPTAPAQKPRSLARFYLQKLINIEVPVPTAGSEAMLNLLTGSGGEEDRPGQREQRLQTLGKGLVLTLQGFVLLAVMVWAAYHASQPIPGKSNPPVLATPSVAAAAKPVETNVEPAADQPDQRKAESGFTSFRADFKPEELTPWPQRIGYGLLLLFVLLAGGLVWVGVNEKARNWLVDYLEIAYKAFGRDWFGPRQTQDTPEFAAALRIWYPLIHETQSQPPEINSPRTVKAFLNRLRCFASRWPKTTGAHGEVQLVALAALHFYLGENNPESWDKFLEELKVQSYVTDSYLKLQSIVAEHKRQFGLPSDDDTQLFKYFIENLEIHKPQ